MAFGVAIGLGFGQLALLRKGLIWTRDTEYENVTALLIWCGASAVIVAALAGGRLSGGRLSRRDRGIVSGAAGLGAVPAMVVAVATAGDSYSPLTPTLLRWNAGLAVVFGVCVAGVLLARRALFAAIVAWQAAIWTALGLSVDAWHFASVDEWHAFLTAVVVILLMSGIVAAVLARSGQPFSVSTWGGLSGPAIIATVELWNLMYWYDWYERVVQCQVASGECYSFGLIVEILIVVAMATLCTVAALVGSGIGVWLRPRARPAG